jgi:hypothetical protein
MQVIQLLYQHAPDARIFIVSSLLLPLHLACQSRGAQEQAHCSCRLRSLELTCVLLPLSRAWVWVWQVSHQLDAVLQQVVEEDESRLVQEQARVLLRAIMVSALC